ncbi:MAG: hypothetical protein K4571_07835 [Deltaproteobacteria bacterium]
MATIAVKTSIFITLIILIIVTFCCLSFCAENQARVATDKNLYTYGEKITVSFFAAPGTDDRDWITIVPEGTADNEAGDYQSLPRGTPQGTMTFDSPAPGKYEARAYYHYSRKGYSVSARYRFAVAESEIYERKMAEFMQTMERRFNPGNPLESNVPPGNGLVYVFREPWGISSVRSIQMQANGNKMAVMPDASYYLFSAPAGEINFKSEKYTVQKNIDEMVWTPQFGEAIIHVKAGHVYYLKVRLIFTGFDSVKIEHVPHEEGAASILRNHLTRLP